MRLRLCSSSSRPGSRVVIELPYEPRPWQVKAHTGMRHKKTGLLICSRQIGKTWCSIAELCHRTITGPTSHSTCYLSPAATQARRIAWPRVKEYLAPLLPHVVFKETELVAVLAGVSTALAQSRATTFAGHHSERLCATSATASATSSGAR